MKHAIAPTLAIAALALYVVACATPAWYQQGDVHQGLWQTCFKDRCSDIDLGDAKSKWADKFRTVRAFSVLSVIIGAAAAFGSLCSSRLIFMLPSCSKTTSAILNAAAAACGIIAMAVYADLSSDNDNYGYSFGLLIVAWIVSLVNTGFSLVGKY